MSAAIEVRPGVFFDIVAPDPALITIEDIAKGLSLKFRFLGFTSRPLSVAEHSYWVSVMLEKAYYTGNKFEDRMLYMQGLLHDSPEAYLNDIITPMKALMPEYVVWEKRLAEAIGGVFGVDLVNLQHQVKYIDDSICLTEKLRLIGPDGFSRPEWSARMKRAGTIRGTFLPRWLDRMLNLTDCGMPIADETVTIYFHWFMWSGRARRLFLKRYRQLIKGL